MDKIVALMVQDLTYDDLLIWADFILEVDLDADVWYNHPLYEAATDVMWQKRKINYKPDFKYNKKFMEWLNDK